MKVFNLIIWVALLLGAPALAQQSFKPIDADSISGVRTERNYWKNGDAEVVTSGWVRYNDGNVASPVDCTGGSGIGSMTRSDSSPISGKYSWVLAKSGVLSRGIGWSYQFKLDRKHTPAVLSVTFDHEVLSGTVADGDFAVFVYDITNSKFLNLAGGTNAIPASIGITGNFRADFQTSPDSVDYRICLHIASTSLTAQSLKIDTGEFGPPRYNFGTVKTDWINYAPTVSAGSGALTNFTLSGVQYMRDGPNGWYKGRLTFNGVAGTFSGPQIPLPSGHVIKDFKLGTIPGSADLANGSGGSRTSAIWSVTSSLFRLVMDSGAGNDAVAITQAAPWAWASGYTMEWMVGPIPIVGWENSGAQMPDIYEGQRVSLSADKSSTTITTTPTIITNYTGVSEDTLFAFNAVTGIYTIKSSGVYNFNVTGAGGGSATAGASTFIQMHNVTTGTNMRTVFNTYQANTSANIPIVGGVDNVYLPAGTEVALRSYYSGTIGTPSVGSVSFQISKQLGAPSMSPLAKVFVSAFRDAGDYSITSASGQVTFVTNKVVDDSFNMMNTSTGVATVREPGLYVAMCSVPVTTTSNADQSALNILMGSGSYNTYAPAESTNSNYKTLTAMGINFLNVGQQIQCRVSTSRSATTTFRGDNQFNNRFMIFKL